MLPRDFVVFLAHPTVTDPVVAPRGKSLFRATIPVANQARLPIDWDQAGPLIERRILDEVGRRLIPDIDDRIVVKFHVSPRDLALDFNAWAGSTGGFEATPAQCLWPPLGSATRNCAISILPARLPSPAAALPARWPARGRRPSA